jgi:hypothetical protein
MRHILALILSLGLCSIANAIPIQIPGANSDIPKNGTGGGGGNANSNNQASNFFRLQNVVTAYNLLHPDLPTPILDGAINLTSNVVGAGGLIGFDYAVLHYGSGRGGTPGGGVELFYLNEASQYTFPSTGTGPNGRGGFSSLTLFKGDSPVNNVPDGASTVTLLGAVSCLIEIIRRKLAIV